jgi:HlyD family secretion protein
MLKRTFAALVGLAAGGALLAACSLPGTPGSATTDTSASAQGTQSEQRVTAETGSIEDTVIGTGAITAEASVDVPFQTSGTIKEILVRVGDQVEAGQTLATLDDAELQLTAQSQWFTYLSAQAAYSETVRGPSSAELRQAQAALSSAQAAYNDLFQEPSGEELVTAQANLQSAEAEVKAAQAAYDRRAARDPGVGASSEALALEQATIAFNKAKASYDALFAKPSNSSVASASAQIQSARASLDALQPISETIQQRQAAVDQAYIAWQQANNKLTQAVLIAPMSGLVTAVNLVPGAPANAGSAIVQIVDFDEPIFVVDVDEADLGKVQIGQDARVRLQTYPDRQIPAEVTSISPIGENNGSITTYAVELTIPKTEDTPTILLNMSGTSEIITTQITDAVLVPSTALSLDSESRQYSVQLLGANGEVRTVPVEIGSRSGNMAQILSGVQAGDVLVIPSQSSTQSQQGGFGAPGGGPVPAP